MHKCWLYQFFLHTFFVNTYDTVHTVLIKIHIVFTIAYHTYGARGEFFSQKSVYPAEGALHPFFGRNAPFPPPQKNCLSSEANIGLFVQNFNNGSTSQLQSINKVYDLSDAIFA